MATSVKVRGPVGWHNIHANDAPVPGSVNAAKADLSFRDIVGVDAPTAGTKSIRNAANNAWVPLDTFPLQYVEFPASAFFQPSTTGLHYIEVVGGGNNGGDSNPGYSGGSGGGGGEVVHRWAIDITSLDPIQITVGGQGADSNFDLGGPNEIVAFGAANGGGEQDTSVPQSPVPPGAVFTGVRAGGGSAGRGGDQYDAAEPGGNCIGFGGGGAGGGVLGEGGGGGSLGAGGSASSPNGRYPGGGAGGVDEGSPLGQGAAGRVTVEWYGPPPVVFDPQMELLEVLTLSGDVTVSAPISLGEERVDRHIVVLEVIRADGGVYTPTTPDNCTIDAALMSLVYSNAAIAVGGWWNIQHGFIHLLPSGVSATLEFSKVSGAVQSSDRLVYVYAVYPGSGYTYDASISFYQTTLYGVTGTFNGFISEGAWSLFSFGLVNVDLASNPAGVVQSTTPPNPHGQDFILDPEIVGLASSIRNVLPVAGATVTDPIAYNIDVTATGRTSSLFTVFSMGFRTAAQQLTIPDPLPFVPNP